MTNKMNTLYENLRTHIFIEYFFRHKKGFISEQRTRSKTKQLFEAYGLFNGCYEISKYICDNIIKSTKDYFQIKINNVSFIDTVRVEIDYYETDSCAFVTDKNYGSVIKNGKYDPLLLYVGADIVNDEKSLLPLIMHELTHAYQHFNLLLRNSNYGLGEIGEKNKYFKNLEYQPMLPKYQSQMKDILYYFYNFEHGAFIATIQGFLKNTNHQFSNIEEICDFIKNTVIFKNYETIFKWVENMKEITDKRTQESILAYVESCSAYTFNTYNQFVKWITNKSYQIQKKFNEIIPKIAYDNLIVMRGMKNANITDRLT